MKREISIMMIVILLLATAWAFAEQKGKICVATQEKSSEAAVSEKAALAPYFLIFDEKGDLIEIIDNPFKTRKFEAGHLMADFLPGKGVTAVIGTDYCGEIVDVLKNKGVTPYNFQGSAKEAVEKLLQGKVPEASK
jgi:predicted Fe-Mo cluster-binding NifX family protein